MASLLLLSTFAQADSGTIKKEDRTTALLFYGIPYRISHMVTVPAANQNTSGHVCITAEKPGK